MSHPVTITVPADDTRALVSAATMLLTMAGKLPELDLDDAMGSDHQHRSDHQHHGSGFDPQSTTVTADGKRIDEIIEIDPGLYPGPTPADEQNDQAEQDALDHAARMAQAEAPAAPAGVELDASGLPWDQRIHASTRTKTKDGNWKKRKGVDDAERGRVESELRQLMAAQGPATPAPLTAPEQPAAPETPAPPFEQPAAPETPAAPTPPTPEAPADGMTFAELLRQTSTLVQGGQITMDRINEIIVGKGVANLSLLANRPDLIPEVWQEISSLAAEQ